MTEVPKEGCGTKQCAVHLRGLPRRQCSRGWVSWKHRHANALHWADEMASLAARLQLATFAILWFLQAGTRLRFKPSMCDSQAPHFLKAALDPEAAPADLSVRWARLRPSLSDFRFLVDQKNEEHTKWQPWAI